MVVHRFVYAVRVLKEQIAGAELRVLGFDDLREELVVDRADRHAARRDGFEFFRTIAIDIGRVVPSGDIADGAVIRVVESEKSVIKIFSGVSA